MYQLNFVPEDRLTYHGNYFPVVSDQFKAHVTQITT